MKAAWEWLRTWSWAPVLGRLLVGAAVFGALALVGAGTLARWVTQDAEARAPARAHAAVQALATRIAERPQPSADAGVEDGAILADGRVVLNLASALELDRLPGIGPKRAEAIVALRTRLGRFRSVRDLLRVRGIGPKQLRRLEPLVVVDRPPEPRDSG